MGVIDDVDMNAMEEDVDMEAVDVEIQTLLLQLKLQLDLRDSEPDSFQFEYIGDNHVLVKCFVPLPAHSSMLPLIPMVLLRMQLLPDHSFEIEILSGTHIYVPPSLVIRHEDKFYLLLPSLRVPGTICRQYNNNFIRITPKLVNELIDQIHTFDPKPSLSPIDTTPQPTAMKRAANSTPSSSPHPSPTFIPMAHVPGPIFQANELQGDRIVRALMISITHTSILMLMPYNFARKGELELAQVLERIPFKNLSRVSYKRSESITLEFQPSLNRPVQTLYAPQSNQIIGLLQENIENFRDGRAKRARYDEGGRNKKGFEGAFTNFLSNVEKGATKVVNQMGKILLGENTSLPSFNVIAQMEADFFRHPTLEKMLAVTESYCTIAQEPIRDDHDINTKAETYMLMFLRQPQVQQLL
ncbi:hypothetical protein THRCLA_11988, partial [Thraustotheca clavata]